MPTPSIMFDGVDLEPYIGTWQEQANSRINAVTVPRRHGALVTDTIVEDARTIQVTGRMQSSDPSNPQLVLRNTLDMLAELFTHRGKQLQLWDDRYIIADKSQFGFQYVVGSALCAADFTLQFFCPDPFWYSLTPDSVNFDLAQTDHAVDITNDIYSRDITVTNSGSIYAYPIITVTAGGIVPLTNITVTNYGVGGLGPAGNYFTYKGTVAVNKSLVIDMGNFTVTNDGVEDLTNFNGDFFAFDPGTSNVTILGTAPANYKFDFVKRYP